MWVTKPLKLIIDNYPDDLVEEMDAVNNPEDSSAGTRKIPFSKVLYIEQEDFRENRRHQNIIVYIPEMRFACDMRISSSV